jgi:hypothetical protein
MRIQPRRLTHGKQGLTRIAAGTPPAAAALLELPPLSRQRPTRPTRVLVRFNRTATMDGGTDAAAISRSRSLNRDIQSLLGRLLQRRSSSKRPSQRNTGSAVALKELLLREGDESHSETAAAPTPVAAAAHRQQPRNTAPDAGDITQPQPQPFCESPTANEMPSATPTTPQSQLQKRASLRDRLKAWQKPPPPLEIVTEESRPHLAYEPKHAAADFSRMVVSPSSPTRQRLPLPTQPLLEDCMPVAPRPRRRSTHQDEDRKPQQTERRTRRHSKPGANRHSYPLGADLFQTSNTAAHSPVSSQPLAWGQSASSSATRGEEQQSTTPLEALSDYELFIARAEAQDRERREQVLRSISQRSAAHSANRVRANPHRQFAAAVTGSSPPERSDRSQQQSSWRHVLGGSSASPQKQQEQQKQPPPLEHKPSARKGRSHARQSSWTPSYATDGSGAAKNVLDGSMSPPQAQAHPVVYGIDAEFNGAGQYQARKRSLRRQSSLSQRIVEYIRPKAAPRLVGTLVE